MPRRFTFLAFLLLAGVAFGVFSGTATADHEGRCTPGIDCGRPANSFQSDPAQELADRYAPIVYLKQQEEACDRRGEAYAPVDVEALFGDAGTVLRQASDDGNQVIDEAPTIPTLYGLGEGYFLDFPGTPKDADCQYEEQFKQIAETATNVAYAHILTEEGQEGLALQYWFYYYFNDWNNNHESDWEMIQLIFDADTVEEALAEEPVRVGYSQHGGGERAEWGDDKLQIEDGHPAVFVAAGAHSNQFEPKNHLGRAESPGVGFGCDDATGPHDRVPLEARLVNPDPGSAEDEYAWLAYEGRWGEQLSGEFNGPTGPNMKFSWTEPITWHNEKLRDANVQVPAGRTAGPSAVNFFCGAVAFGSNYILSAWATWPILTPLLIVLGIGAVVVSIVRTDFAFIPPPLRKERRFGQIIRSAFRIYRLDFVSFITIALVLLPAGLLAAAVHALIIESPIIDDLLALADTPRLLDLVIAVALGSVVFGLAYLVVIWGVTAILVDMEAGIAPRLGRTTRTVWDNVPALLIARLKALLIVLALVISIIGIPWAIHRAVRWTFIEQAILMDGATRKEAAGVSSRAVEGHWLGTLGRVALLLGIGLFAGPLLVVPLLFFIEVPLQTVNLLSSLIYILLMPAVSIAIALTYCNLTAGKSRTGDLPSAATASEPTPGAEAPPA